MVEFTKVGRADMLDYMGIGPDGGPVLDCSKLSRNQGAALIEVTVEHFLGGRGDDASQVRRVRFRLASKSTRSRSWASTTNFTSSVTSMTGAPASPTA
jgi:phage terminase small subunit